MLQTSLDRPHTYTAETTYVIMATPGPMNPDAVTAQVKRLINTQLRSVLKSSNLPVSGAKAAMQERIITSVSTFGDLF